MATDRVFAISIVRDEADIIEYMLRQLFAQGVDSAIVVDNGSTDGTRDILVKLAKEFPLVVIQDLSIRSFQSRKMTELANAAHVLGAEWIIPFDADELFYSTGTLSVADTLREIDYGVVGVAMVNYFATSLDDAGDSNPFTRERWHKRELNPLDKVCFRWCEDIRIEPGNHHISVAGRVFPEASVPIQIGHFQNRSPEHLIRKVRAEARIARAGRHDLGYWYKFASMSDEQIKDWWTRDYYFTDPQAQGLVYNPAPYFENQRVLA